MPAFTENRASSWCWGIVKWRTRASESQAPPVGKIDTERRFQRPNAVSEVPAWAQSRKQLASTGAAERRPQRPGMVLPQVNQRLQTPGRRNAPILSLVLEEVTAAKEVDVLPPCGGWEKQVKAVRSFTFHRGYLRSTSVQKQMILLKTNRLKVSSRGAWVAQ